MILHTTGWLINTNKAKEMVIFFGKHWCLHDVPPLCINSRNIERVVTFKLIGVVISSDLTWDAHDMIVSYILSKCTKRYITAFDIQGWITGMRYYLLLFIVQLSDLVWSMRVLFGILDCLTNCLKTIVCRNFAWK